MNDETLNTDTSESPYFDAEEWEIGFKPYATNPDAALDMARNLMVVKEFLQRQPPDVPLAIVVLDEAIDTLFPLTRFHNGAYDLFRLFIEGRATRAHESLMESLGVKI